jgi:hypothetical protein
LRARPDRRGPISIFTMSNSPRANSEWRVANRNFTTGLLALSPGPRLSHFVFTLCRPFLTSTFLLLSCSPIPIHCSLFPFAGPEGRAERRRRPDAAGIRWCVHDRTRALTFSRREPGAGATRRRASRRSTVAFSGTSAGALFSLFPGPGSNGCSWGQWLQGRRPALRRCGRKPRRGRHTSLRLTGPPPEGAPHEQG